MALGCCHVFECFIGTANDHLPTSSCRAGHNPNECTQQGWVMNSTLSTTKNRPWGHRYADNSPSHSRGPSSTTLMKPRQKKSTLQRFKPLHAPDHKRALESSRFRPSLPILGRTRIDLAQTKHLWAIHENKGLNRDVQYEIFTGLPIRSSLNLSDVISCMM